jgi:hypothetical protein
MLCEQGGMPLMTHVSMPSVMSMPSMMSLPQMTFAQPQQPHQVPYRTAAYRVPVDPAVLRIRVPVPFLTPRSGMGKNQDPDFGMNITDYISESFKQFFGLKYINSLMRIQDPGIFLTRYPGWKKFGPG